MLLQIDVTCVMCVMCVFRGEASNVFKPKYIEHQIYYEKIYLIIKYK